MGSDGEDNTDGQAVGASATLELASEFAVCAQEFTAALEKLPTDFKSGCEADLAVLQDHVGAYSKVCEAKRVADAVRELPYAVIPGERIYVDPSRVPQLLSVKAPDLVAAFEDENPQSHEEPEDSVRDEMQPQQVIDAVARHSAMCDELISLVKSMDCVAEEPLSDEKTTHAQPQPHPGRRTAGPDDVGRAVKRKGGSEARRKEGRSKKVEVALEAVRPLPAAEGTTGPHAKKARTTKAVPAPVPPPPLPVRRPSSTRRLKDVLVGEPHAGESSQRPQSPKPLSAADFAQTNAAHEDSDDEYAGCFDDADVVVSQIPRSHAV